LTDYRLEYPVNYDQIDPFKVVAQERARATDENIGRMGLKVVTESRGESGFVIEFPDRYLVFVVEGLGTKNRIADSLRLASGEEHYSSIARCLLATYANDALTLGAEVFTVGTIIDAGASEWFADERRYEAFCNGFAEACNDIGAVWGPGESAHLPGIIMPDRASLSGACIGQISPKDALTLRRKIKAHDRILLLPSSGIHANYLTACYELARQLPEGFETRLETGETYGEALLAPTVLYQPAIMSLMAAGILPNYMVHITGHGWRKLMRAQVEWTYVIEELPAVPSVCKFVKESGDLSDYEAYAHMNMGAGFAVVVASDQADQAQEVLARYHPGTVLAGYVTEGPRSVFIKPLGVQYADNELVIR